MARPVVADDTPSVRVP